MPAKPIAIVSANFGGIDPVWPLPPSNRYDGFYYTDREEVPDDSGWSVIRPAYPRADLIPRLRAKYFKLQAHRLPEVGRHTFIGWIDARVELLQPDFFYSLARQLGLLPPNRRCAFFPHPWRKTVEEEYERVRFGISEGDTRLTAQYAGEDMAGQMEANRAAGYNMSARLLAGGAFLRENSPLMNEAWDHWWDQNLRWTVKDQLSLPLALSACGIKPLILPGDIYQTPALKLQKHGQVM